MISYETQIEKIEDENETQVMLNNHNELNISERIERLEYLRNGVLKRYPGEFGKWHMKYCSILALVQHTSSLIKSSLATSRVFTLPANISDIFKANFMAVPGARLSSPTPVLRKISLITATNISPEPSVKTSKADFPDLTTRNSLGVHNIFQNYALHYLTVTTMADSKANEFKSFKFTY
uniref:Uncharacterized protein n=1 Tax=Glossina brevipalpis TaxID=37001 RepID=A0A1A9W3U4_9MUSC